MCPPAEPAPFFLPLLEVVESASVSIRFTSVCSVISCTRSEATVARAGIIEIEVQTSAIVDDCIAEIEWDGILLLVEGNSR